MHGIVKLAGTVRGCDEDLVLDSTGAQQRIPVHDAGRGPGRRDKENGDVLQGQGACGFREADIIADQRRAFDAVDGVGDELVPRREIVFLTRRREQMRFFVARDELAAAVEYIACIQHVIVDACGDGAADDIDLIFRGQLRKHLADAFTIRVRMLADRMWVAADIPKLGQQDGVRPLVHRRGHHVAQGVEIRVKILQFDWHLQDCCFHLSTSYFCRVYRQRAIPGILYGKIRQKDCTT